MFRYLLALLLVFAPDEINDAIARAESLYYEAKFKESIQLLLRVDEMVRPKTDRIPEKVNVKLQIALASIGLNDTAQARSAFRELYAINSDYRLDPQQFPPKVLALANEAKAEQNEIRCQAVRTDARKQLENKNAAALLDILGSMKSKCTGLEAFEPDTAELLYKTGLDAYKRGEFSSALDKFRSVMKLAPKHELAAQYIELTQGKLQVSADRAALDGQRDQMRADYKKTLLPLVDSWNRACASDDNVTMNAIRKQVSEMTSDPLVADEVLAQMSTCTKKTCLQMNSQFALARLKVRVNPVVPPAFQGIARRSQPSSARVKARIDEKGEVLVLSTEGESPVMNTAIRTAIQQWKFSPIVDQTGPRCVETEIPIVIKP